MTDLTQNQVKTLFEYDPSSGILTWRGGNSISTKNAYGYFVVRIDGVLHQVSRIAWLYMTGSLPENQIDHINGHRDDNRFANLRDCTVGENRRNCQIRSDNTSGRTGVYWHPKANKWMASICKNKKQRYLGLFESFDLAVEARLQAESELGFHKNHGRSPTWG